MQAQMVKNYRKPVPAAAIQAALRYYRVDVPVARVQRTSSGILILHLYGGRKLRWPPSGGAPPSGDSPRA